MEIYTYLDESIYDDLSEYRNHGISINELLDFLCKFSGKNREKGFIFTLNQDLLIERLLFRDTVRPFLPWIEQEGQCNEIEKNNPKGIKPFKIPESIDLKTSQLQLKHFNLIKLHGSYNWLTPDNENAMVLGGNKKDDIEKEPLLKKYFELFEKTINQQNTKLWIIGYGFQDKHINTSIANAIDDNNLSLHVICPNSPREFLNKQLLRGKTNHFGKKIWNVLTYYNADLKTIFPVNRNKNTNYIYSHIEKTLDSDKKK